MSDRNNTIEYLKYLRDRAVISDGTITEQSDWIVRLCDEVLELLKEQEPREWIYCEDDSGQDGYQCSGCGFFEPWYYNYTNHDFIKKYQFCPSCGAIMNARYWKQREADDDDNNRVN